MYFLKAASSILFLIILIDGFTEGSKKQKDESINKLIWKTQELVQMVEKILINSKENCRPNDTADREYERIVSEFLKQNFTLSLKPSKPRKNGLKRTNFEVDDSSDDKTPAKKENFVIKIKNKLTSLVHRNQTQTPPVSRLKRCLTLSGAQAADDEENFDGVSNVKEFDKFLHSFISCLETKKGEKKTKPSNEEEPVVGEQVTSHTSTTQEVSTTEAHTSTKPVTETTHGPTTIEVHTSTTHVTGVTHSPAAEVTSTTTRGKHFVTLENFYNLKVFSNDYNFCSDDPYSFSSARFNW